MIVTGRGDAEPIAANAGSESARNRRVEITVAPLPVLFHAPDPDKSAAANSDPDSPAAAAPPAKKNKKPDKVPAN